MKKLTWLGGLLVCMLLVGCGGSRMATSGAPLGTVSNGSTIRVGDKITVQLSGVPEDGGWIHEYQVPASGEIYVPLLTQSFHAVGLSQAELGSQIADAYKNQKMFTNPQVTVLTEERFIIVGGDVRAPSNVVWRPDSTVMSTINSCGGFTEYADRRHVRILRGQQSIQVDCITAIQTPGADPAVFPGDQLYVPRTMF